MIPANAYKLIMAVVAGLLWYFNPGNVGQAIVMSAIIYILV